MLKQGEKLKLFLENNSLSVDDAAIKAGVTRQAIYYFFKKEKLTPKTQRKLKETLGFDLNEMTSKSKEKENYKTTNKSSNMDSDEKIRLLESIIKAQQQQIDVQFAWLRDLKKQDVLDAKDEIIKAKDDVIKAKDELFQHLKREEKPKIPTLTAKPKEEIENKTEKKPN